MKYIIAILSLTFSLSARSQQGQFAEIFDSIIKEADLLYAYEKAVWVSTDQLLSDKKLKKQYGGYIVFHFNDTILVTMLNKNQQEAIARYSYVFSNLEEPVSVIEDRSEMTMRERTLWDIKVKISEQLADPKYEVTIPQGYDPNLVLLKENSGYKLYIIMGTSESGVIPFGNDYLFRTDSTGNITKWQKFHSRMIPAFAKSPQGQTVVSSSHSHLKSTPYITATDICTFRLYAPYTELKEFSVYSGSVGEWMLYSLEKNSIILME